MEIDPLEVKAESERVIRLLGGQVLDWLPYLEHTSIRSSTEIEDRALVMNAMIQIYFKAPINVIHDWIKTNQLTHSLSNFEADVLSRETGKRSFFFRKTNHLSRQEMTNLYWYIEALWGFAWAGSFISELPIDQPVGDSLASYLPNIQRNEDTTRFRSHFVLRSEDEVYQMRDLYFRAHWYAREGQLRRFNTKPFDMDIIMERRHALEWMSDRTLEDWEDASENT
jgi:hypothetical protein